MCMPTPSLVQNSSSGSEAESLPATVGSESMWSKIAGLCNFTWSQTPAWKEIYLHCSLETTGETEQMNEELPLQALGVYAPGLLKWIPETNTHRRSYFCC